MTWFNLMKEKGCEKLLEECSGENAVLKQRLIMVFDAWELNERSPSDYTKKELDRVMKRSFVGFCLFLLAGYLLVVFLDSPVTNVGLLKVRGFCRFCDLTNANLREIDLGGADLYYADLTGANLSWSNLSSANLNGTDLTGADLTGADLRWANLSQTDLRNRNFEKRDLRWVNLAEADLRNANLIGADLSEAYLIQTDLRGADMRSADLRCTNLSGADLTGANLEVTRNITKAVFNNTTMPDGTTNNSSSEIDNKISEYCKIWISTNAEPD
mgnify:CR=1 FL=1